MKKKKHQVKCLICGEKGFVEISRIRKKIYSNWVFFGTHIINLNGKKERFEYWECPKCYDKIEQK